ncbi:hypothetical protein BH10BAC5_BH10BAC5_04390 [soil metagenome]
MDFFKKYGDTFLRPAILVISAYFLSIILIMFVKAAITDQMSNDDAVYSVYYKPDGNSLKIFTNVIKDGIADKAGIKEGDILLSIDDFSSKDWLEYQHYLNSRSEKDVLTYTIQRGDRIFTTALSIRKYFHTLFFIFLLLGFTFLIIGTLVGYAKPKEGSSIIFYLMCITASIGFLPFGGVYLYISTFGYIYTNILICSVFFFPLLTNFFLIYPIKYPSMFRKIFIPVSYLAIIIVHVYFFACSTYGNTSNLKILYTIAQVYTPLVYVFAGLVFFTVSFIKVKELALRKSLKIILVGFITGGVGFIYYFFLLFNVYDSTSAYSVILRMPCILVLAIPISLGYSIFKYRILDTEFIVKKSLVFSLVTFLVVSVYLIVVFIADNVLGSFLSVNRQIATIAVIIFVTFTFDFVNKRSRQFVDRQFFRERYNYRKSLLDFTNEIQYLRNIKQIIETFARVVKTTMNINRVELLLKEQKYYDLLKETDYTKDENFKDIDDPNSEMFFKFFRSNKEPVQLYDVKLALSDMSLDEKEMIKNSKIVLTIPLFMSDTLIGVFNFGGKVSGKAYSDEDIDLLTTLCIYLSAAFENSRLQAEEFRMMKIQEELQIAHNIQKALLPELEAHIIKELDISGTSLPAKEIGGDFYDIIHTGEKKYFITIGDVSGKGIPAALYMAKVQAMLQFASSLYVSPSEILKEVNEQVYNTIDKNSFITITACTIDLDANEMKLCRAGHNPLIRIRDGITGVIHNRGIGVGLDSKNIFNSELEETILKIRQGDIYILYTDGLTESFNEESEEYGFDNLLKVVSGTEMLTAKEIKEKIIDSEAEFRGEKEQSDDLSVIVIKVN